MTTVTEPGNPISSQVAVRYVNVATQIVGVYRLHRMPALRDHLASSGDERIVRLGEAGPGATGNPHETLCIHYIDSYTG